MISPDLVSEALVAKLRASPNLTSVLPEGIAGVREESWKGTRFRYPNVRVVRPDLKPWGNGNCTPNQSTGQIIILVFSKKDSSINVQLLQGKIVAALEGERLDTVALVTLPLRSNRLGPSTADGEHWRGEVNFRTVVFPK